MVRQACRGEHALGSLAWIALQHRLQACMGHVQAEHKALERKQHTVRQACCSRIQCAAGEQPGRPPCCCRHRVHPHVVCAYRSCADCLPGAAKGEAHGEAGLHGQVCACWACRACAGTTLSAGLMVCLTCQPCVQLCAHHDHTSQVPQEFKALEGDRPTVSCACAQGLLRLCLSRLVASRSAVQGWHMVGSLLLASWLVGCGCMLSHWHKNALSAVP